MQRQTSKSVGNFLIASIAVVCATSAAAQDAHPNAKAKNADALAAIVGVWQSDTTNGVSALSSCAWTPEHGGVLCEQRIRMQDGEHRALSLFTFDSATARYVFYVLSRPGDSMNPVPLAIDGRQWIYGGNEVSKDGKFYRTVNDFSKPGEYSWRQESSTNARDWVAGAHGNSKRLR